MIAFPSSPILKVLSQRLLLAGKPQKLALTALTALAVLMRKLILLANRLLKNLDFSLAH